MSITKFLKNIFNKTPKQAPPRPCYDNPRPQNPYLKNEEETDLGTIIANTLQQISTLAYSSNHEELEIESNIIANGDAIISQSFSRPSHIRLHHVVNLCRELTKQIGVQKVIEASAFCEFSGFKAGKKSTGIYFVIPLTYQGMCVRFDASITSALIEDEVKYILTVSKKLRCDN